MTNNAVETNQAARLASDFYYGERRKAVAQLVDRLDREHGLARGWTRRKAIQSVMALTNHSIAEASRTPSPPETHASRSARRTHAASRRRAWGKR